jgi:hypothetical protein
MKKKRLLTRSALSQPSNLGSSETTREAPLHQSFYFDYYFDHCKPEHIKSNDSTFLEWFIGFCEGDGSFITSKEKGYFIINQKDIKLLYKIRTSLGFGCVFSYIQNDQTYGRYVVQSRKHCERLAHLFGFSVIKNK